MSLCEAGQSDPESTIGILEFDLDEVFRWCEDQAVLNAVGDIQQLDIFEP